MENIFRKIGNRMLLPDLIDGEGDIIPIIADGEDRDIEDIDAPESVPVLSLRNIVLFPGLSCLFPLAVQNRSSLSRMPTEATR